MSDTSNDLELLRQESEAWDIIKQLEKINSFNRATKARWVWELLQNAKDVASPGGVNVYITLTKDQLLFEHDGEPFERKHLLAVTRKNSTKASGQGEADGTGKYGTGFVTTHVLSKQVFISGVLKNAKGERRFENFIIDRAATDKVGLMGALNLAYKKIAEIDQLAPETVIDRKTAYKYQLNKFSYDLAKDSLLQLRENLPFTLLINKQILSVTINEEESGSILKYDLNEETNSFAGASKVHLRANDLDTESGLVYVKQEGLYLAVAVNYVSDKWSIVKRANSANVFKEFPLIGTEDFHIPFFLQSNKFIPTEERDGIRTVSDNIEEDQLAITNRAELEEYKELSKKFISLLIEHGVSGVHLLAESGLPDNKNNYLAVEWYSDNVQNPVREYLVQQPLVKTVSGEKISLLEAIFISDLQAHNEQFYSLLARSFPEHCTDSESYRDWIAILNQDIEHWGGVTIWSIEDFLKNSVKSCLTEISLDEKLALKWVNDLSKLLIDTEKVEYAEDFTVYPNKNGQFLFRNQLKVDPGINENFIQVSKWIDHDLEKELLHPGVTNIELFETFDLETFLKGLNAEIGDTKRFSDYTQDEDKVKAIIHLTCLFEESIGKYTRRQEFFQLINTLLPTYAPHKISIPKLDFDFNWDSAIKWSLKYLCYLVQSSQKPSAFAAQYFNGDEDVALKWLNELIEFTFRSEETNSLTKNFAIVPTQNDQFKIDDNKLYLQDSLKNFDDELKSLYKEYVLQEVGPNGELISTDPRDFLIDTRIHSKNLNEIGPDHLTKKLDKFFATTSCIDEVKPEGKLNELFLNLSKWYDDHHEPHSLFPEFSNRRADLMLSALNQTYRAKIIPLLRRKPEDLEQLSKLNLPAKDLAKLESLANQFGGTDKLMEFGLNQLEINNTIASLRKAGDVVEAAFKTAISGVEIKFNVDNPDYGMDFSLSIPGNEKKYYIEIKGTVHSSEGITMSQTQGNTASTNESMYALGVLTRGSLLEVDAQYFIDHARFTLDIGERVKSKVNKINTDLALISSRDEGEIQAELLSSGYSLHVSKKVWEGGRTFQEFIEYLSEYFGIAKA